MPSDVCIKRFLTIIPGGKRLFIERKDPIKVQISANDMAEWFRDTLEKIEKQLGNGKSADPAVKEDKFVFPINHEVPSWAQETRRNIKDIRLFIGQSSEKEGQNSEDHTEILAFNQKKEVNSSTDVGKVRCGICSQPGHPDSRCFLRICNTYGGKGHDSKGCTSAWNRGNYQNKNVSKIQ